jgi:hypothetical protein
MSITGIVEKGSIKLPPGVNLPDGTPVVIQTQPDIDKPEPAKKGNSLAWMKEFAGCIDNLPEDFAAEHDHYIHGTPKRGNR